MARVHALTREEAPPDVRSLCDANMKAFGQILNTTGIWAYRPTIQLGVKGWLTASSSPLSSRTSCAA